MSIDFLSCFCYDKIKVGPLKGVANFILPHRALRTWKPILIITLYIALYHRRPQELHSMNLAKLEAEKKKNYILSLPSTTLS